MNRIPLYEIIKERLRNDLLDVNQEGVRLPSERELQDRYQVSRPTISKALASLAGEGFLVKQHRRGLFTTGSLECTDQSAATNRVIGYVAPLAGEELIQRAFRGVDRIAHRRGYRVLMGSAGNDVTRERDAVMDFVSSGASGLIITPFPRRIAFASSDYLLTQNINVPIVLLDTCLPEQGRTQVIFDNQRLGYSMTEWLIGEGHRRIALLTFFEEILHGSLMSRHQGYRDAHSDFSLPYCPELVGRFDTRDEHEPALEAILDAWQKLTDPPTAIIAPEDSIAMELISLMEARGILIPDEICVTGFDNRTSARHFEPPFPTSNPDFERMGEMACSLLIDKIETGVDSPQTLMLEAPLYIRSHTRAAVRERAVMSVR